MRIANGGASDWARQIRRYRRLNFLKQAALADILGVDQATISRWERGQTLPERPMQLRLVDLMRSVQTDEALLKHTFSASLGEIMLSNVQRVIQAASVGYSAAHGVRHDQIVGMRTDPMLNEENLWCWRQAYDRGFYRGDVASVSVVARGHSLCGHVRERPAQVVWFPVRLADGEIFRRVERRDLSEDEFARIRAQNGGPIRIVTLDDLLH